MRAALVLTCLLAGCPEDKPADTADETGHTGETGEPAACADLEPDTCATRSDCTTLDGRLLHDDGDGTYCVDFGDDPVAYGCMDADWGCGAAETLAAPPDDPSSCTWFSSTCVPTGWVACGGGYADECAR